MFWFPFLNRLKRISPGCTYARIFSVIYPTASIFDYTCQMMDKVYKLWNFGVFALVLLTACNSGNTKKSQTEISSWTVLELDYAKGYVVREKADITHITVNAERAWGDSLTYLLIPRGTIAPVNIPAHQVIEIPVKRMVATSTSHIPLLEMLGSSEALVGFPNTEYISSSTMRSRINQQHIKDVGSVNGLDFESLIELQPELVVSYISGPDRGELEQLDNSGIPAVVNLEFLEETPLGRAEWIKFMGLLLGKFDRADSVFKVIEKEYLQLRDLSKNASRKPEVFSGILYGDVFFAPGGDSFVAKFIEHAGGIYSWSEYHTTGSIELSFEAVLDRNSGSDFWIGTGGFTTKTELVAADPRYRHFKAFKTGKVYNYHRRIGATGGFEYLELGGARPDLVLADFIKILHPELLPDYQCFFFKKLE